MGKLEKESKKRASKVNLQKAILFSVFTAGELGVALTNPTMKNMLNKLDPEFLKSKFSKYSLNRSIERLKKNGLIAWRETKKGNFIRLTPKGEAKLRQLRIRNYKIKKPKKWDGKWRLMAFDIKEGRKSLRNKVRFTLKQIGFIRLQDSVWVYPYDCEDLMMLLKADFKIGKDLIYIIADSIENDKNLRKEFNL